MLLCPLRLDIDPLPDGSPWLIDEDLIKIHCGIDDDDRDTNLQLYASAGILWFEHATRRTVIRREHRWVLGDFPARGRQSIRLPRGKTLSVAGIAYSVNGSLVTLTGPTSSPAGTDYQEDIRGDGGAVLMPPRGGSWPGVDCDVPAPVTITFTAGWAVEDIPSDAMNAILMATADAFDLRSSEDFAKLNESGERLGARNALAGFYHLPRIY